MPRRGRPSREERDQIIQLSGKMSVEDIAKQFDRTPAAIAEIISDSGAVKEPAPEVVLRKELRATVEWKELKRQFNEDELKYFEEKYANWMVQLKENITPSEETQVFLLLKNEILINRGLVDKRRATSDMSRMQTMLDDLYDRYPGGAQMSDPDKQLAVSLNEQISACRSSLSARTKELIDLQKVHADLMKHMKATRDQRLKRVESAKESFIETMKELMVEDKRLEEGEQMELMRMAADKEVERLAELHEYADGTVDRPFLNADTVGIDEP